MQLSYVEIAQSEEIGPLRSSEEKGPCDSQVFIFPTFQEDELASFVQMHNCILTEAASGCDRCRKCETGGWQQMATGKDSKLMLLQSRCNKYDKQTILLCTIVKHDVYV